MAKYICPDCKYEYDEFKGDPHEGFPAGTPWSQIPEEWSCPDCAVRDKVDFELVKGSGVPVVAAAPAPTMPAAPATPTEVVVTTVPLPSSQKAPPKVAAADAKPFVKWICITCGHIYDEALGDDYDGFAPGTRFEDIPDDWCCPDCGATKEDYVLYQEK